MLIGFNHHVFITLTLQATIHLNMTSAIQKDVGRIKDPSSFRIKASKELENLGLFISKIKAIKLLRFRETKIRRLRFPPQVHWKQKKSLTYHWKKPK